MQTLDNNLVTLLTENSLFLSVSTIDLEKNVTHERFLQRLKLASTDKEVTELKKIF